MVLYIVIHVFYFFPSLSCLYFGRIVYYDAMLFFSLFSVFLISTLRKFLEILIVLNLGTGVVG